jgi:transcription factor C subunit 6
MVCISISDCINTDLLPTHYIYVHQSVIRSISWIRAPPASDDGQPNVLIDPTVIASGGHDGMECLTDIRDPFGNTMNRTRGILFL